LTEELGDSRTPVREGLIVLESEGLIVSAPNRGNVVRIFAEQDVTEIFSMQTTLEDFAGQLVMGRLEAADFASLSESIDAQKKAIQSGNFKIVRRIDMAFHRYLIERSHHGLLLRQWTKIVAQIAAVLYLRAEAIPNYDEFQSINDHTSIVQAYQDQDLVRLRVLNAQINQRVAQECQLGVALRAKQISKTRSGLRVD
jgi:DNA-binding GntR family transcriptional regulator